jgi:hypothetical protein
VGWAVSVLEGVDPRKLEEIVRLVGEGATLMATARQMGLKPKTVQKWVERGCEDDCSDEALAVWAGRVRQAQGLAENTAVGSILRAAKDGDWRAALAWLERHPTTKLEWARAAEAASAEKSLTLADLARLAVEEGPVGRGVPPRVGPPEVSS